MATSIPSTEVPDIRPTTIILLGARTRGLRRSKVLPPFPFPFLGYRQGIQSYRVGDYE